MAIVNRRPAKIPNNLTGSYYTTEFCPSIFLVQNVSDLALFIPYPNDFFCVTSKHRISTYI